MTQATAEKKRAHPMAAWLAVGGAALIAAALLAVFYCCRGDADFACRVSARFSQPVRRFMALLCSHISLSVMEIFYAVLILGLLAFLVRTVWLLIRRKNRLRRAALRLAGLLLAAMYLWAGLCWLWGVDYFCPSFSEQSGLASAEVDSDALVRTTRFFLENANRLAAQQPRDAQGHFAGDTDSYFAGSAAIYSRLQEEFPCLAGSNTIPKKMLFSRLMSRMGFTGVYFPFTGEANINVDVPGCTIPFTIAHELAHQRGVTSELEANFVGIAACLSSGDPVYEYSGYLSGLMYLMNAIYRADYDTWDALCTGFSPELRTDWNDNILYWRAFESSVTTASETVYDEYLKAQGQDLGIASYDACVRLLLVYYG